MARDIVWVTCSLIESLQEGEIPIAATHPNLELRLVHTSHEASLVNRILAKCPAIDTVLSYDKGAFNNLVLEDPSCFLLEQGVHLTANCPLEGIDNTLLPLFFQTITEALSYIETHHDLRRILPDEIAAYGKCIAEGELVAFPTETVYGLGADAFNEQAVKQIFAAKERPFFDPLIVHIAEMQQLDMLVSEVSDQARLLMQTFWPGPLTLVMKKHPMVPSVVTAGSETVAVRMPDNLLALALIKASGKCIAAPSANRFGYTSPTTANHVKQQLSGRIAGILDGGSCTVGIESTVLSLYTNPPTLLRPGKIGLEELEPLLGTVATAKIAGPTDTKLESPGMLESHYAPKTPLYLVDDVTPYKDDPSVGILLFERSDAVFKGPTAYVSECQDSQQAANRLYWAIRKLDSLSLRCMVCSLLPEKGIGVAINNRLRKASKKTTR